MVTKISRAGGEKLPRKLRGLLALFLSLFVFFSSLTVYAADYSVVGGLGSYTCYALIDGKKYQIATSDPNLPFDGSLIRWPSEITVMNSFATGLDVNLTVKGSFNPDDVITFSYKSTGGSISIETGTITIREDKNTTSINMPSSQGTGTYTVQSTCNSIQFSFSSKSINTGTHSEITTRFTFDFSVKTAEVGLLTSILDFIKQIPSKIGEFFTNLVNNLKSWFDNIGNWFTELGNKISGFFTNLFNNIKEFFTSLFKPSDGYFDELREDLNAFLSDHLGFIWTIPTTLFNELTAIVSLMNGSHNNLRIYIPAFEFNLLGKHYELLEGQYYNLYQAGNMPWLDTIITVAHAMIDMVLIVGCAKMIYKKIINKVGVEGGDEL